VRKGGSGLLSSGRLLIISFGHAIQNNSALGFSDTGCQWINALDQREEFEALGVDREGQGYDSIRIDRVGGKGYHPAVVLLASLCSLSLIFTFRS
jgi:hypothetical protein